MGKHQCTACKRTFRTAQGLGLHFNHARKNPKVCDGQPRIDPRDAEIAALKAEVERLKRALAAGPAAVRKQAGRCKGSKRSECLIDAAEIVVAAQVAAMKGEK